MGLKSEQYIPLGAADLAPYLTKIKYSRPDMVIAYLSPEAHYIAIFKQIMEVGDSGDIKFVSASPTLSGSALKMPGAEGSYHWALWAPGLPYPGAQKFEQDFLAKHGRLPGPTHVYHYICLWMAISAIEMAGTDDPQTVAQATRSSELEWESPPGTFVMGTDSENSLPGTIFLFQGVNLPRSYLSSSRLARERKSSDCLTDKEAEHGF